MKNEQAKSASVDPAQPDKMVDSLNTLKIVIIITACCLEVKADADAGVNLIAGNSVRFRHIGSTATVNHHAYLITQLNLTEFFITYLELQKKNEALMAVRNYTDQAVANQLSLIIHKVKSTLRILLRTNAQNFEQILTNRKTLNLNRKKRNTPAAILLKNLLGFGLNKLKEFNANKIYQNSLNHTPMIQTLPPASTLLIKTAKFLRKLFPKHNADLVKINGTAGDAIARKKNHDETQMEYFRREVTVFMRMANMLIDTLASLMKNKLPIATLNQTALKQSFNNLVTQARDEGYTIIDADYTAIYTAITTTFQHKTNPLVIELFTCIPIRSGTLLELYQFRNAPLLLDNNLMVYVDTQQTSYLALNAAGSLFQEFTPTDISQCTIQNTYYHCPNYNQANNNEEQSCLYNIFQRNIPMLLKSCKTKFKIARSQTMMVAPNTYKILVEKPTTLFQTCNGPHHRDPKTFEKHLTFTLSKQCPKAHTTTKEFVFRTESAIDQKTQYLPISAQASNWFQSDPTQIRDFVEKMQQFYNFVPYSLILHNFDEPAHRLFVRIKQLVQDIVLACVLLYATYKICHAVYTCTCKCCNKCIPHCQPRQESQQVTINKVVHVPMQTRRTTSYRVPPHISQALLEPA